MTSAASPLEIDTARKGEIIDFKVDWVNKDFEIQILEAVRNPSGLDLTKADIIVAGGFGAGNEGFAMLQELVDATGESCVVEKAEA